MTYHLVITTYYLQLDTKYLLSTVNLRLSILYIGHTCTSIFSLKRLSISYLRLSLCCLYDFAYVVITTHYLVSTTRYNDFYLVITA